MEQPLLQNEFEVIYADGMKCCRGCGFWRCSRGTGCNTEEEMAFRVASFKHEKAKAAFYAARTTWGDQGL